MALCASLLSKSERWPKPTDLPTIQTVDSFRARSQEQPSPFSILLAVEVPNGAPLNSSTPPNTVQDHQAAYSADPTWAATHMAPTDNTKQFLGITIEQLERGRSVLSMLVRPEMANGFGITHGGMVFTLAD